ncbi:NADH:flavin oxidoreductase/NADH oxidase [Macroventuria anomochaeta]|uniref:NADH:flavin oxidoreductase/NADH oxidase n=1 Tax=Macroventuria anomochaeta TaxID=301207 RepID=A0ACB6RVZ8_9PLEO|nr:NADH:flavin oxidoreductase/NADH oxidase [Macroventuria anomochaeta]KAF2626145.1 NADH:flavin oxidoreductase/NADH oxidase [Macroventuria anomochaeta]
MSHSKLFAPLGVGTMNLQHRIAMAPLTRLRADDNRVQVPLAVEYYTQRACVPGTLLIAEAMLISPAHAGMPRGPGIWTSEQIAGWKSITDAVHAKGCSMVCQLVAPGRAADAEELKKDGFELLSSSAVPMPESGFTEKTGPISVPKEMTDSEIQDCIRDFARAAQNAMTAGFDGIEIHGANGYLIDQFLQDTCNHRGDFWGGSIANRCRFGLEVAKACAQAIGSERVGFRVSPWSPFQGMRMADPVSTFSHLVEDLKGLELGYLHIIESRVNNNVDCEGIESVDFLLEIWGKERPVLLAGGYTSENVWSAADGKYGDFIVVFVFGRHFLANPDLVHRIKHGLLLNKYDRGTFYVKGRTEEEGYTDYSFAEGFGEAVRV